MIYGFNLFVFYSIMGGNFLILICNKNCSCFLFLIRFVCGLDKLMYFFFCFVGCILLDISGVRFKNRIFF